MRHNKGDGPGPDAKKKKVETNGDKSYEKI
jgi:hypothetical protein